MENTTATEWVSVAEAAVRLEVDPKTIQRRLAPGHRKHLRSRPGQRGVEVEVPAKTTTAEVASALTVHAEREIQLAGTLVASVERERRTMRSVALIAASVAIASVAALAGLWNAHAQQTATLAIAKAEAEQAKRYLSARAEMLQAEGIALREIVDYQRAKLERMQAEQTSAGQLLLLQPPMLAASE